MSEVSQFQKITRSTYPLGHNAPQNQIKYTVQPFSAIKIQRRLMVNIDFNVWAIKHAEYKAANGQWSDRKHLYS